MNDVYPPFSISFTPQVPEWLHDLKCSIALTSYQSGKVILISPSGENNLVVLPRNFEKPMGMALRGNRMLLATDDRLMILENNAELARTYPPKPDVYDSLFIPTATYHTGHVDIHDIDFGEDDIWVVNTSFSCLCRVNGHYNFIPEWKPPFITGMASEDRCHLNGMVMRNGKPWLVTALGMTDTMQGWREHITTGGILMDVQTNTILLDGLAMPHTPIVFGQDVFVALSASGKIIRVNTTDWSVSEFADTRSFCRGMDIYGDYLFVATSKLRQNSSTFRKLEVAKLNDKAAVLIYHIPTRALVGSIVFQKSVDEIYALKILPGMLRPNILNTDSPAFKLALSVPGATYWGREIKKEPLVHNNT